ncbi:flagellar biosynthesis anti-sigma factor FlgM, partial [Acinetobacter baumannii]
SIDPTGSAKVVTPPRVNAVKPAPTSTDAGAAPAAGSSASDDTVHLTGDAVQIHQLAAAVAKAPAVDVKKVADVRQAIS